MIFLATGFVSESSANVDAVGNNNKNKVTTYRIRKSIFDKWTDCNFLCVKC
ncbi:hypothetical protein IFVP203_C1140210 [Vibrio parahaemolyticus]